MKLAEVSIPTITEIVFEASTPSRLAVFWAAILDGYTIRPYDDAEIARLAGLGFTPETDPTWMDRGRRFAFNAYRRAITGITAFILISRLTMSRLGWIALSNWAAASSGVRSAIRS